MDKEVIEVDGEALAAAADYYGTTTKKETVNAALRDAADRQRRLAAFDRLVEMAQAGDFDCLLDKRSYRR